MTRIRTFALVAFTVVVSIFIVAPLAIARYAVESTSHALKLRPR